MKRGEKEIKTIEPGFKPPFRFHYYLIILAYRMQLLLDSVLSCAYFQSVAKSVYFFFQKAAA